MVSEFINCCVGVNCCLEGKETSAATSKSFYDDNSSSSFKITIRSKVFESFDCDMNDVSAGVVITVTGVSAYVRFSV